METVVQKSLDGGSADLLVGEAGIEPTTPGLEGRCSIQLSYSPIKSTTYMNFLPNKPPAWRKSCKCVLNSLSVSGNTSRTSPRPQSSGTDGASNGSRLRI